MGFRYGTSWRTGPGRRAWVSGPLWLWVLGWLVLLPFAAAWIVIWLAVRLIVAAVRGIAWLARRVHAAFGSP